MRAMSTTQEARGEGLWGATAKGLQSVSTPEYRSVEEIHADEGRLQNLSQEEYDALLQDVANGIEEVIEEVRSTNKAHSDNRFEEADIIGSVMIDAARGKHTAAAVTNTFHKEGYTISRELAEKIVGLYDQAASVPTGYFEAKPQRAVPLDEILAAVVPNTMDEELRAELESAGVPTITYQDGDTQSRMDAVNSVEGAKFSISEEEDATTERREAQEDERVFTTPRGVEVVRNRPTRNTSRCGPRRTRTTPGCGAPGSRCCGTLTTGRATSITGGQTRPSTPRWSRTSTRGTGRRPASSGSGGRGTTRTSGPRTTGGSTAWRRKHSFPRRRRKRPGTSSALCR